jgi:hypothetical protein
MRGGGNLKGLAYSMVLLEGQLEADFARRGMCYSELWQRVSQKSCKKSRHVTYAIQQPRLSLRSVKSMLGSRSVPGLQARGSSERFPNLSSWSDSIHVPLLVVVVAYGSHKFERRHRVQISPSWLDCCTSSRLHTQAWRMHSQAAQRSGAEDPAAIPPVQTWHSHLWASPPDIFARDVQDVQNIQNASFSPSTPHTMILRKLTSQTQHPTQDVGVFFPGTRISRAASSADAYEAV